MNSENKIAVNNDARKLFRKLGTCSRTFCYILNREFGNSFNLEERATSFLAGGIVQQGYQCGMLWGVSLAVGIEAHRRYSDSEKAAAVAINVTQHLLKSFINRTGNTDCLDLTNCDWSSKLGIVKYFLTGNFMSCFNLARDWAPDAVRTAADNLNDDSIECSESPLNCASEVVRKLGGNKFHAQIVSGYAGGLGLSGNACGALAAAIWYKTYQILRDQPQVKNGEINSKMKDLVERFCKETDYEFLCGKITQRKFESLEEHSEYMQNGGCGALTDLLAID